MSPSLMRRPQLRGRIVAFVVFARACSAADDPAGSLRDPGGAEDDIPLYRLLPDGGPKTAGAGVVCVVGQASGFLLPARQVTNNV